MITPPARTARYGSVAIVFHWTIAVLIIANLLIGLRQQSIEGMARFELLQWHKSIGITVLLLSVLRVLWRLGHKPPAYPADIGPATRRVATAVHWTFYALMFALPLTGWLLVSASPLNIPTLLYDVIPWPHLPVTSGLEAGARIALTDRARGAHELLTWLAYLLIALHVAAALRHQFIDRDGVLWRMAPFARLKAKEDHA